MDCREFEAGLNRLIDAGIWLDERGSSRAEDELSIALARHRSECERCQRTVRGFELLRRAIASSSAPLPSAALADRIERATGAVFARSRSRRRLALAASAAAVAGLMGLWLGSASWRDQPPVALVAAPGRQRPVQGSLGEALAQAASATWDLARETSDPAARLGRPLFDKPAIDARSAVESTSADSTTVVVYLPSLSALAPDTTAAAGALAQVGDRLVDGVRPLSDSARRVFGRLLEPPRNPPHPPPARTSTKGV